MGCDKCNNRGWNLICTTCGSEAIVSFYDGDIYESCKKCDEDGVEYYIKEVPCEYCQGVSSSNKKKEDNIEDKPVFQVLYMIRQCVISLKNYKLLSVNGEIEATIFFSHFAKRFLQDNHSSLYYTISSEFYPLFLKYLIELGLQDKVQDMTQFIISREQLYNKELDTMQDNLDWLPSRIYSLFYDSPLAESIESNIDLTELMKFNISFRGALDLFKQSIDIINEYN